MAIKWHKWIIGNEWIKIKYVIRDNNKKTKVGTQAKFIYDTPSTVNVMLRNS